jgi:hypothetical protein
MTLEESIKVKSVIQVREQPRNKNSYYRIPKLYEDKIRKEIEKLNQQGLIESCEYNFASPMIVVKKEGQ